MKIRMAYLAYTPNQRGPSRPCINDVEIPDVLPPPSDTVGRENVRGAVIDALASCIGAEADGGYMMVGDETVMMNRTDVFGDISLSIPGKTVYVTIDYPCLVYGILGI